MTSIYDIADRSLVDTMVAERFINVSEGPDGLLVWNYSQRAQYENEWNDATLSCRGLITTADGDIKARPFRKFFNLSQLEQVPEGDPLAQDKMDGSLGIIYPHPDGRPAVATRGSFKSEQAAWATSWLRSSSLELTCADAIRDDVTPLVEIIYPENRIVVEYGDRAELVLLTGIDIETGEDVSIPLWHGSKAAEHPHMSLDDVLAAQADNAEGYVLRWRCGTRAKVKFAEYVRLHKLLTGVNARTIWELRSNGSDLADLIELVPDEFYDWVHSVDAELHAAFTEIECAAVRALSAVDTEAPRRDQAEVIKRSEHPGIVFSMLDGKDHRPAIWRLIRPSAEAPFRCGETA